MRKLQLSIVLIIQLITLSCSNWHLVNKSEYDSLNQQKNRIRVRLVNNKKYEPQNYVISPDSLVIEYEKSLFYEGSMVSIPLDSVSTIKSRKVDTRTTVILGLVTVVAFYAVFSIFRGLSSLGGALR